MWAAQGGTWAYFINYGHDIVGLSAEKAGYFFGLSMLMMVIGPFGGHFTNALCISAKQITLDIRGLQYCNVPVGGAKPGHGIFCSADHDQLLFQHHVSNYF